MSKSRRAARKALSRFTKKNRLSQGVLGRADGTVSVPNNPFLVYVRESINSPAYPVYNFRVPNTHMLPVLIGEDPLQPGIVQVLSVNWHAGITIPQVISVTAHAITHFLTGTDPIYIDTSQIINGLVSVYDGMTISVSHAFIQSSGQLTLISAGYLDLSSYIPVSGALYALLRVDSTGECSIQVGDVYDSYLDLDLAAVPIIEAGYTGLAFIRLYSGQILLSRDVSNPDVRDIRFSFRPHEKLDNLGEPDDNTDLDSSDTRHGLLPKLSGVGTEYLDGLGGWSVPEGGGGSHAAVTLDADAALLLELATQEIGLDTQTANTIFAGPTTGAANEPTFRVLVAADVGTGTPTGAKFLRDDMSWQAVGALGNGEKIFTREGVITATAGVIHIGNHSGVTRTLLGIYLKVNTAPTGANLIVDIHKNGTTIFTTQANRPVIVAGNDSGNSTTIDVTSWTDGQYLTCDVDQVGSTIAGSNLTVTVVYS